jgi:glycosyltransferase involved in cell wall biosynthesis
LRIVVEVSPLSHFRTGIPNYIRGALSGLAQTEHEIVAFAPASRRGASEIRSALTGLAVELVVRELPVAHGWRIAWSRLPRPRLERLVGRFDVLHVSDWAQPPQGSGVRAATVYDLVTFRHPEWSTRLTRWMHRTSYRHAARRCDVVFAISEHTAGDAVELLGIERERIRIARPGVDERFRPEGERSKLGRPYVLTVATLEPRKNLSRLLEAHALLDSGLALALAGGEGWGEHPLLEGDRVLRLGYVDHDRLAPLYRGAEVFVFPSLFEGFGIPVLEAMASGVPCVVSSHRSLDEAAGDAAIRVDPERPEAIAAGIERALSERDELVRRGIEHARRFSWRATAEALLGGYADAARLRP